jgi:hypothetical protein
MTRKKEKKWARISKCCGLKRSAVLFVFFVFFVLALPGLVTPASGWDVRTSTEEDNASGLVSSSQIQAVSGATITYSGGLSANLASSSAISHVQRVTFPMKPRFYIIVDEGIYGSITAELDRYMNDIRAEGKYVPMLIHRDWVDEVEVKNQLKFVYTNYNLAGALFVGDIPVAYFEKEENFPDADPTWVDFPMDLFYMDMDGFWEDTDLDRAYDVHEDGNGDVEPEIFVGRLYASTVTIPDENGNPQDEVTLIRNYFDKNHAYRTGNLSLEKRSLIFVDTPWKKDSWRLKQEVDILYNRGKFYNDDGDATHKYYYMKELGNEYEWVSVMVKSSQNKHTFDYDTPYESTVENHEISEKDPKANFYNLHACKAARYTYSMKNGYIGGHYIFAKTYGVCAVGQTKAGGMYYTADFYTALSQGANIGEALLAWFVNNGWTDIPGVTEEHDPRDWSYCMVILGDPTLVPNMP